MTPRILTNRTGRAWKTATEGNLKGKVILVVGDEKDVLEVVGEELPLA
jgi:hypothetical protein